MLRPRRATPACSLEVQGSLRRSPPAAPSTRTFPLPTARWFFLFEGNRSQYEIDAGSNAWVVGGHWTTTGMPLVAGDSHRGLDTPSVYYQVYLAPSRARARSGTQWHADPQPIPASQR